MNQKKAVISVVRSADDVLVKVEVFEGDERVGKALLPGGDEENARGMAEGLLSWAEAGGDITTILPD